MKIFVPDYYENFRCRAGDCLHSCCIGWEIDIDDSTARLYQSIPGEFGEKLRKNIDFCEGCSSIRLCEDERCPFLNEKGLCEVIINLGEEAISDICTDHPRFRNYFSDRTEIGLGLCCEEAAELILRKKEKTSFVLLSDDGEDADELLPEEEEILSLREGILRIIQDRELPLPERIGKALALGGAALPEKTPAAWAEVFLRLERLDEEWTRVLGKIKGLEAFPEIESTAAEQLLVYFINRHLPDAPEEGFRAERIAFAALALRMISAAAEFKGLFEGARLFSSEIEYSDENVSALLGLIHDENEVSF